MLREYLRDLAVRRGRVVMAGYLVFALAVTGIDHWSIWYDKELGEAIVPLTGWSGLGTYMWTLYFAALATFIPSRRSLALVIFMLGVGAVLNGQDCWRKLSEQLAGEPDFGNPYLMYDLRRPLVTVLPVVVWVAVLWLTRRSLPVEPRCGAGGCGFEAKAAG